MNTTREAFMLDITNTYTQIWDKLDQLNNTVFTIQLCNNDVNSKQLEDIKFVIQRNNNIHSQIREQLHQLNNLTRVIENTLQRIDNINAENSK